jgi:methionyl-tRNA formyltransferase
MRAFDPFPGAHGMLAGESLKLWRGRALPGPGGSPPGRIVSVDPGGVDVQCGIGCLRLLQLQRPSGKRLAAAEFVRGFELKPGMAFQPPSSPRSRVP